MSTKSVAGDYRLGTTYTVLSATGGRSGTYTLSGRPAGVSAFLGLRDSHDANNAYLTVVQTRDPVDAAQTPNQQAVAENLPAPVVSPVLNLPGRRCRPLGLRPVERTGAWPRPRARWSPTACMCAT